MARFRGMRRRFRGIRRRFRGLRNRFRGMRRRRRRPSFIRRNLNSSVRFALRRRRRSIRRRRRRGSYRKRGVIFGLSATTLLILAGVFYLFRDKLKQVFNSFR